MTTEDISAKPNLIVPALTNVQILRTSSILDTVITLQIRFTLSNPLVAGNTVYITFPKSLIYATGTVQVKSTQSNYQNLVFIIIKLKLNKKFKSLF